MVKIILNSIYGLKIILSLLSSTYQFYYKTSITSKNLVANFMLEIYYLESQLIRLNSDQPRYNADS